MAAANFIGAVIVSFFMLGFVCANNDMQDLINEFLEYKIRDLPEEQKAQIRASMEQHTKARSAAHKRYQWSELTHKQQQVELINYKQSLIQRARRESLIAKAIDQKFNIEFNLALKNIREYRATEISYCDHLVQGKKGYPTEDPEVLEAKINRVHEYKDQEIINADKRTKTVLTQEERGYLDKLTGHPDIVHIFDEVEFAKISQSAFFAGVLADCPQARKNRTNDDFQEFLDAKNKANVEGGAFFIKSHRNKR